MDPRSECHGSDAELLSSIPIMNSIYGLFYAYSTNPCRVKKFRFDPNLDHRLKSSRKISIQLFFVSIDQLRMLRCKFSSGYRLQGGDKQKKK